MKYVLVVGGGKVGSYLASLLIVDGYTVRVIEGNREDITWINKELPEGVLVEGDGTDPRILEAAGIRNADVVAAVSRGDATNLVITSLARFEFKVPRTIARVNTPKNAWLFTPEMDVDIALNQADLMAHLIAEEMTLGDMMTLLKLRRGQYSIVEYQVDPGALAAGKQVRDLDLPRDCILTAILREGEMLAPRGETVIQPGDTVLALVHSAQLDRLASLLGTTQ